MFRFSKVLLLVMVVAGVTAGAALAGKAHFVGDPTVTRTDNSITVEGKVAGLGNVPQIDVQVTGTAQCVNPGSNKPKAANKQDISAGGQFPVQNGKADFSVTATATFQPSCSPPMTVEFSNVTVTVTAADGTNLTFRFQGTF
jgi:hypothetical protein